MSRIYELISKALSVYGETTRDVILWHLENTYGLKPPSIEENPEKFISAMKDLMGDLEESIERTICEAIAREYGIEYDDNGFVKLLTELKNTK